MRLRFLLARRVPPVPSPVLVDVTQRLVARGFDVTGTIPEEALVRADTLEPDADLYLLKSHTELALSLAGVLHERGARLLNPYESCVLAQDKVTACRALRAAGVPVPRTFVAADAARAVCLLGDGPLVVKPHRGHRGAGVVVIRDERDLRGLVGATGPLVVQDQVPGPGEDLKVYTVGERVFAVRKPFSPNSFTKFGRPCPVTPEVRDLALRSGNALGLGLFGLDVIESRTGPVVVDVNYFPGYKGVPEVAPLISDYIEAYALGRHSLALAATPHPVDP
ncbi:MAG: ATP-grasp domain-containing protein [Acidimicrobiia bacterium]